MQKSLHKKNKQNYKHTNSTNSECQTVRPKRKSKNLAKRVVEGSKKSSQTIFNHWRSTRKKPHCAPGPAGSIKETAGRCKGQSLTHEWTWLQMGFNGTIMRVQNAKMVAACFDYPISTIKAIQWEYNNWRHDDGPMGTKMMLFL